MAGELAKAGGILDTGLARETYDEIRSGAITRAQVFSMAGLELGLYLADCKKKLSSQSSDLWSQFAYEVSQAEGVLVDEDTITRYADVCEAGLEFGWGNKEATISHWLAVYKLKLPDKRKKEMLDEAVETRMSKRELEEWVREELGKSPGITRDELQAKIKTMEFEQLNTGNIVKRAYEIIDSVFLGKFDEDTARRWLGEVKRDYGGFLQ